MPLPVSSSVTRHIVLLGFIAQELAILDGSVIVVVEVVAIVVVAAALLVEMDPVKKLKVNR